MENGYFKTTIAFLLLLLGAGDRLFAQGTDLGAIRGTVTDPAGSTVPHVEINLKDLATGLARTIETDGNGRYEFSGLQFGRYLVSASLKGFNMHNVPNVIVHDAETVRVDIQLELAGVRESVTITTSAPIIGTESPMISNSLDNRDLTQLPRDSRDIYSFLYLSPNITQAHEGTFKFLGAQTYGASFSVDGLRTTGVLFGEPTLSQPTLESIGELTVMSDNFSAEYSGIASIRIITKRGESNYHGSLVYQNKNSALAAWDIGSKLAQATFLPTPIQSRFPRPFFNQNEGGGAVGGPFPWLRKTFVLLSYERLWLATPASFQSTSLPHPSLWAGDFSLLPDSVKPPVPAGINLTPDEISRDTVQIGKTSRFIRIPQRLLNPTTSALIERYFPTAGSDYPIDPSTGRMTRFIDLEPQPTDRDRGTIRLDHDAAERDRLFLVLHLTEQYGKGNPVVNPFSGLGLQQRNLKNTTSSLSYIHLFGPHLFNEVRGGYNRQLYLLRSNTTLRSFLSNIGYSTSDIAAYGQVIGGNLLDTFGHPAIQFGSGFTGLSNGGSGVDMPWDERLLTIGNTLTLANGKHTFKAGFDLVRNHAVDGSVANPDDDTINPRGQMTYTGPGPTAFSHFLLGLPAGTVSYVSETRPAMRAHNWEQGYFVQDDYRISRRVTLNLGLRYELITPFTEDNNLFVNFDPGYVDPSSGTRGRFVVPSAETIPFIDPRIVAYGVVTAKTVGLGPSLVKTDRGNFAPRFGLAWSIGDHGVLRAGYGLYYPTSAAQATRDTLASAAFNQPQTKGAATGNPLSGWPGFVDGVSPLTGGTLRTFGSQLYAAAIPFDLHQPRIQQYNVSFERETWGRTATRVSYIGTGMSRLITGKDLNMIAPSNIPFATTTGDGHTVCDPYMLGDCDLSGADLARLPFPAFGDSLESYGNFGHGRSQALQLEWRRPSRSGLTFSISYTLLDQKSSAVDSDNSSLGGTAYNQFQPNLDYARDSFVSRHRLVAHGIVELPVSRDHRLSSAMPKWAETLFGSWQLSWQMFVKSGTGFTPYWTCDDCGPVFPGNIASGFINALGDFSDTSFRPLVVGDPQKHGGNAIWDRNAFAPPPLGADLLSNPAVAKRNILTGPSTWGLNVGLRKRLRFSNTIFDLGADFDNLLNHPLWSPDNNSISNLGSFSVRVDPSGKLSPITDIIRNPDFGRLLYSYPQEGIDSRRSIRLSVRLEF
jgi:hypothetical protein